MKRVFLVFSLMIFMVCCGAAAESAAKYLWDLPLGSHISTVKEVIEPVLGGKLHYKGKHLYTYSPVIIKGLSFDFSLREDEREFLQSIRLNSQTELAFPIESVLSDSPLTFSQVNAILQMLVQKFGQPQSSYWYFGPKYPIFDAPFFDFDTIISASQKYSNSVELLWNLVHFSICVSPKNSEEGTRVYCIITESATSSSNNVETLGQYSEEVLVMNSGISSF